MEEKRPWRLLLAYEVIEPTLLWTERVFQVIMVSGLGVHANVVLCECFYFG